MKVLIAETKDFSQSVLEDLSGWCDVDFRELEADQLRAAFMDYDVFWFRLGFKIDRDLLMQEGRRVRVIVCPVTGLDHIDMTTCDELGIKVISLKGEYEFLKEVRATAEHTIGLTLALLRNISAAERHVRMDGEWKRDLFKGSEIYNKKVGIVGLGRLGEITAGVFSSFGARVLAYDVLNKKAPGVEVWDSLEEMLPECDIVSLHINYTEQNIGFFDANLFNRMKRGSYFINTSRGSLINESDLIESLKSGHLAGAALDVVANEPNIKQSPLWHYAQESDSLLITPHIGGNTWESFEKTESFLLNKLRNIT